MVVAKGRGPWRFWWINFLSRELLVFVGPCRFFFLGGFPGQRDHVDSCLSFLSLAFSPPENTGFWIFEIWILDVGFLWVLNFGFWILDFGSWIFVDLRFGLLIPSTTKGLESLVLSMFLWCHRALAKSWDLGFGLLIPSTTKGLESLVLSMFLWCHRALAKSWDLGFGILIPSTTKGLESLVLSMFLWCHRALAKSWDLGFGILIPSTTKGLESLVLSMFLWCHRALAKSWDLGFGILIFFVDQKRFSRDRFIFWEGFGKVWSLNLGI